MLVLPTIIAQMFWIATKRLENTGCEFAQKWLWETVSCNQTGAVPLTPDEVVVRTAGHSRFVGHLDNPIG